MRYHPADPCHLMTRDNNTDVSLFRVKFHWYLCNEVHVSVVLSLNELFYDIRIIFNVLGSDGNGTVWTQTKALS